MNRSLAAGDGAPGPTQFGHIVAACDRFEALSRSGELPRIESFLAEVSGSIQPALLRELLALELELRRRNGEHPTVGEYGARFPGHFGAIAAAFSEGVTTAPADPDGASPGASRADAGCNDGSGLPQIPGHEVLAELGRGGMGVVYLARQIRLNRLCALKMILAGRHAGPEAVVRFLAEAETIARLRHDGVVQVYGVGDHDGCPYIELEYLAGGSLAQALDGTPRPGLNPTLVS